MELLLFFVAMLCLWVFMRFDAKRMKSIHPGRSESTQAPISPALSRTRAISKLSLGGAAVFASLAAAEWFSPTTRPYTGRYALLKEALYSIAGDRGVALFWLVTAALLILFALAASRAVATGDAGEA